jgi:hypothetical protein
MDDNANYLQIKHTQSVTRNLQEVVYQLLPPAIASNENSGQEYAILENRLDHLLSKRDVHQLQFENLTYQKTSDTKRAKVHYEICENSRGRALKMEFQDMHHDQLGDKTGHGPPSTGALGVAAY